MFYHACSDYTIGNLYILRVCHMNAVGVRAPRWRGYGEVARFHVRALLKRYLNLRAIPHAQVLHPQVLARIECHSLHKIERNHTSKYSEHV